MGTPFPMFLNGTCVCGNPPTLCDHVVFTFNLTHSPTDWAVPSPTPPWPTYLDSWEMTNIQISREQQEWHDPSLQGCLSTPGSQHNSSLCMENGVNDPDCCALPGQGACRWPYTGVVSSFVPKSSKAFGSCGGNGIGEYTCCDINHNASSGVVENDQGLYPKGHDQSKCQSSRHVDDNDKVNPQSKSEPSEFRRRNLDGHEGSDDTKCSSSGNDCCACDKSLKMNMCDFNEPATCKDDYVPINSEEKDGSCMYRCYKTKPETEATKNDHNNGGFPNPSCCNPDHTTHQCADSYTMVHAPEGKVGFDEGDCWPGSNGFACVPDGAEYQRTIELLYQLPLEEERQCMEVSAVNPSSCWCDGSKGLYKVVPQSPWSAVKDGEEEEDTEKGTMVLGKRKVDVWLGASGRCVRQCGWGLYAVNETTTNKTKGTCVTCKLPTDDPKCALDSSIPFVDRTTHISTDYMPWDWLPYCTQSLNGTFQVGDNISMTALSEGMLARLSKAFGKELKLEEELKLERDGRSPGTAKNIQLPCRKNGDVEGTGWYKMLVLPVEGGARRSVYDDVCFTKGHYFYEWYKRYGPNEKLLDGRLPTSTTWFQSDNTQLASLTMGGAVAFLIIISSLVGCQDCIQNFAPDGHCCKKVDCKHLCESMCIKKKQEEEPEEAEPGEAEPEEAEPGFFGVMTGDFIYYMFVSMPFTMLCSLLLNPGTALGTFVPLDDVTMATTVWNITNTTLMQRDETELLLAADYIGGAMFELSLVGGDTILMILFVAGVCLPCFCTIPIFYLVAMVALLVCLIMTNVQNFDLKLPNWNWFSFWNYLLFSVNIDWSTFRLAAPNMLQVPAMATVFLGLARISGAISRCWLRISRLCRTARVAGKVVAEELKQVVVMPLSEIEMSSIRNFEPVVLSEENTIDPQLPPATTGGDEGEIKIEELAVDAAKDAAKEKIDEKVEEKLIEVADAKANKMMEKKEQASEDAKVVQEEKEEEQASEDAKEKAERLTKNAEEVKTWPQGYQDWMMNTLKKEGGVKELAEALVAHHSNKEKAKEGALFPGITDELKREIIQVLVGGDFGDRCKSKFSCFK